MDQNQSPSFEIPKSPEAKPVYSGGSEFDPSLAVEGTREILPAPHTPASTQPPLTSAPANFPMVVPVPTGPVSAMPAQDAHLIAEDVDVMEKEWVERAKKIVSMTSHDPYLEAIELGKLKSTYIKKRFNKDLPVMPNEVK